MTESPGTTTAAWRMAKEFGHSDGVTYSPGEPVPTMTLDEAEERERGGFIVRADALPVQEPVRRVVDVDYLLAGDDLRVLRRLREHRVPQSMLQRVLAAALTIPRSENFVAALELAIAQEEIHYAHRPKR